jgi:hypothetical protein
MNYKKDKKTSKLRKVWQTPQIGSYEHDNLIKSKIKKNIKLNSQTNQMLKDLKKYQYYKNKIKKKKLESTLANPSNL